MTRQVAAWLAWSVLTSAAPASSGYCGLVQPSHATKAAGAIQEVTVQLTAAQARNFEAALVALSTQAGAAFVAEGRPLRPVLGEKEANEITTGHGAAPLSQVVAKLAAAFDYDVQQRRGSGVFVLTKRYTNPQDLPGVTLDECLVALADVERVMAAFNPRVPFAHDQTSSDPLIADFAPTLTPEQLALLEAKQLPLASLSPAQRQAVQRFALYHYVQKPAQAASIAASIVQQGARGALGFGDVGYRRGVFGYEAQDSYNRLVFHSLEDELFQQLDSTGAPEMVGSSTPLPGPKTSAEAAGIATTLGKVAAALNARSRSGGIQMTFVVDAALAAKPVTVVGTKMASPTQIWAALAEAYGLRVRTDPERNEARLTRRAARLPRTAAGIGDAVRQALPVPLLRAVEVASTPKQEAPPLPPEQPKGAPLLTPEEWQRLGEEYGRKMEAYQKRQRDRAPHQRPAVLRQEAVRRLRLAVEPELKAKAAARVPVSRLGEPERAAFALALMTEFLTRIRVDFGQDTPPYIARFDELLLGGGPYRDEKGAPKFGLHLLSPSNGGFGPGTMNMQYDPRR